jgi:hypothetical protein
MYIGSLLSLADYDSGDPVEDIASTSIGPIAVNGVGLLMVVDVASSQMRWFSTVCSFTSGP